MKGCSIMTTLRVLTVFSLLTIASLGGHRVSADDGDVTPPSTLPLDRIWTRQFGTPTEDSARSVAVDPSGNVCVVGWTDGSMTGYTNAGGYDAYIASFDKSGHIRWAHQWGTKHFDYAQDIVANHCGDTFVLSNTRDVSLATTVDSQLTRYSSDGCRLWSVSVSQDPSVPVLATSISIDRCGRLFVTGYTNNVEWFVTSFHPDGSLCFWKKFHEPKFWATDIQVDRGGCLYVVGGADSSHSRIVRLDSAGRMLWSQTVPDANGARTVAMDPCDRPIVMSWGYRNTLNSEELATADEQMRSVLNGGLPDQVDIKADVTNFVSKFDAAGSRLWHHRLDQLVDAKCTANSAKCDHGRILLTGHSMAQNKRKAFVATLNDMGEFKSIDYIQGKNASSWGFQLESDRVHQLYLVGHTTGQIGTEPNVGSRYDAFVIKFHPINAP